MKQLLKIALVSFLVFSASCSEYNKLVKSADMEKKYEAAIKYYEKGDFIKAQALLEELIGVFRGTAKAEQVFFYYSFTCYELEDYVTASYHFKNFAKNFPSSSHAEECAYMNAYCYYLSSPSYSLDQSDTRTAVSEMQTFMDKYPRSERIPKCNLIMDELRAKLEKKDYENSKQYFYVTDYKSAITAFNNVLKEYPGTSHREELNFLILKSNYMVAVNSIEKKKEERIGLGIDTYLKFVDVFPKSDYLKQAESIYDSLLKLKTKVKT